MRSQFGLALLPSELGIDRRDRVKVVAISDVRTMNYFQADPAENPFVYLKVRRLALWLILLSLLLGIVQGIVASALQIEPTDVVWTWVVYIVVMVSLCLLVLWQFDRHQVQLEDVAGRGCDRANWLRLAGLTVAVLLSSLGWFFVSFYLLSL
ncbi:MAG: hypothetical protein HC895_20435, partial [Leptolyngbyaceae cyanobacterium SM1_3_5]|nr:hypothetical protein [Leptolyngbyaceae cyanobacterium SM1_3_5]